MITIILALYFTGLISQETAITFLYVIGLSLLIAAIGVVSFGLLGDNVALTCTHDSTLIAGAELRFADRELESGVDGSLTRLQFLARYSF